MANRRRQALTRACSNRSNGDPLDGKNSDNKDENGDKTQGKDGAQGDNKGGQKDSSSDSGSPDVEAERRCQQ